MINQILPKQRRIIQQELWAFSGNRISARFEYEWHDGKGQWYRSHGNEQWQFDDKGAFAWLSLASHDRQPWID